MRNSCFIWLLIIIGFFSCTKEDNLNCNPETINTKWISGKEITVTYNTDYLRNDYNIGNGENILFEYNRFGAECDDIIDDEWGENLTFIINKETTDFEFTNGEIVDIKCFYQPTGAWVRHNQYQIKDGIIKGKKISENIWEISVSILTTPLFPDEQPTKIEFVRKFKK